MRVTTIRSILVIGMLFALRAACPAQEKSFIVLGDMHYDRLDDHDLDYVMTRPQDYEQIFNEYPQYTAFFMPKFLQVIKKQATTLKPQVGAIVQLGDLVEGVAGNAKLARQMNRGAVDMLHALDMPAPWVLVKGNHDVSNSPGQPEAWEEVIRPFMEGQVKKSVNHGTYSIKLGDDVELFALDQFFSNDRMVPETEMVAYLDTALANSTATYKFVMAHQPVIPVTQRCWHLLSGIRRKVDDPALRDKFLGLLAKHKVIVLAAHLHKYSVLARETPEGTIVQVMVNSVNRGLKPPEAKGLSLEYKGEKWVEENPAWQPSNQAIRKKILAGERKHITSFKIADLPGYAVISVSKDKNEVRLDYYNGLSEKPYESINLLDLQKMGSHK